MRKTLIAAALLAVAGPALAGRLVINNTSKWDVYHVYVSATDEDEWGPDQLGDNVLHSDQEWTLTGVDCGDYDIRVVDEDGDACILRKIEVCGVRTWQLDDDELLGCQADTRG